MCEIAQQAGKLTARNQDTGNSNTSKSPGQLIRQILVFHDSSLRERKKKKKRIAIQISQAREEYIKRSKTMYYAVPSPFLPDPPVNSQPVVERQTFRSQDCPNWNLHR